MSEITSSSLSPREELYMAIKEAQEERGSLSSKFFGSRQSLKESTFDSDLMAQNNLLMPPFDPERMYTLVESSGILPQCIDAMMQNIDGFGYDFQFLGTTETEDSEEAIKELTALRNFFDQVNEKESFRTIRLYLRKDVEATGNGYIEVIRFMDNTIATMYHMDSKLVRLQAKQDIPYVYKVKLWRNGKLRPIPISRRFRRYAMKMSATSNTLLRWFKEYGDPRRMCALTGRYDSDLKPGEKIVEEASEVLHFKIGTGAYGVPRWSGQIANALGMNSADYVNWDLFENQVVPPLAIMVSGGTLTAESVKDIRSILLEKKGVENFNKVLILEAQSEGNITDKSATKIELKEMSAARKEDAMFVQYTDKGEHRIRSAFRLPPMMAGRTDCFDEETQTLTEQGWKFYWEVQENEKIATFNPETEAIEYHVPNSGLRLFDYEGPMYHFKNSVVDIKVSPEHDMWAVTSSSQIWSKISAKDLYSQKGTVQFLVAPSETVNIDLNSELNEVYYKGKIYCFDVPNHLFVTRRKGKISIQGNTYSKSCYSEDTETLTENGWKNYWEILPGERVATYNPETNRPELHIPNGGLLLYDHEGDMVHFCNRNADILVTPNHDMYWCQQYSWQSGEKQFNKIKAELLLEARGKMISAPFSPYESISYLPEDIAIPYENLSKHSYRYSTIDYREPLPSDVFVELIGFFIADGYSSPEHRSMYNLSFGFTKQRKIDRMSALCDIIEDKKFTVYRGKDNSDVSTFHISDKGLYNWARFNCGIGSRNKRIPFDIFKLSGDQRELLLDVLIFCDGTEDNREGRNNFGYFSNSELLIDQIQYLAILCGHRVNKINSNRLSVTKNKPAFEVNKHQVDLIPYSGKVYCFNVPNHLFITRRNGKVAIQGNTADSSKMVAEEQIFVPERSTFDEVINMTIMRDLMVKYWAFSSKGPRLITGKEIIDGFKEFSKAGVITINEGIRLANRVLNMDITKYDEPWADYPIPIVIELAKMGVLKELDEISTITEELSAYIMERRNPEPTDTASDDETVDEDSQEEEVEPVEPIVVEDEEKMIVAYTQISRLRDILKHVRSKHISAHKD